MFIKRPVMLCCLGYCTVVQAGTGSGQIASFTPGVLNGTEIVVFTVQVMNNDRPACNTDGRLVSYMCFNGGVALSGELRSVVPGGAPANLLSEETQREV